MISLSMVYLQMLLNRLHLSHEKRGVQPMMTDAHLLESQLEVSTICIFNDYR